MNSSDEPRAQKRRLSRLFRDLNVKLSDLFKESEYTIVKSDDEEKLYVRLKDSEINILSLNLLEVYEESKLILNHDDNLAIGKGFFNFLLKDTNSSYLGDKIKVSGTHNGEIERKHLALAIILMNPSFSIDLSKIIEEKTYDIEDILFDNLFIGTINDADFLNNESLTASDYKELIPEVDQIIFSLLSQISFEHNVLFNNPRAQLLKPIEDSRYPNRELKIDFKMNSDTEPLLYFLAAEEMEYPHLKYLEYYHVLEYYFNHARMQKINEILNHLITVKLKSKSKDEISQYYKYSSLMDYHLNPQKNKESDQLTEIIEKDIKYSLIVESINEDDIDPKFLSEKIFNIEKTVIGNYSQVFDRDSKKLKSRASLEIEAKFCPELSRRIYKIRNHIVHTKKYEHSSVFVPNQKNFQALSDDLKLIRIIAFLMLIHY